MNNTSSVSGKVICLDMEGCEHEVKASELRWRPSVYAIIIKDGKILLSKQHGYYTVPGGGLDLGEQPEDALIREVKEETGYDVAEPKLLACKSTYFKLPKSTKGAHIQSILLFYACKVVGGEASAEFMTEDELEGGGEPPVWVTLERLDELPVTGTIYWRELLKELRLT